MANDYVECPKCGTRVDVVEEWWNFEEGETIEEKCGCGYTVKYIYNYNPQFHLADDSHDELLEEEERLNKGGDNDK